MLRDLIDQYYLDKNHNCAETTLRIINDAYHFGLNDEDIKLVSAAGGGFSCGMTCGALVGAMAALGKLAVKDSGNTTEGFKELCIAYANAFAEKCGGMTCSEIRDIHYVDPNRRCIKAVQLSADVFEEFVEKYQLIPAKQD